MLLTIDTDNKTVSVKGQVKFCEVYTQLKKMFPDSYKEFVLKQEVETVPVYPYQPQPIYDGWFPVNAPYIQYDINQQGTGGNPTGDTYTISFSN